ncbi:ABC transporter permease [bacterium]|nr:ABC transporter permease [bacterium]
MKIYNALRALARLEIRNLKSARMRTLLTGLLIAVPIAAIVAVVNIFYVIGPTGDERAVSWMGQADLRVETDRPLETLRSEYPVGTQFEPISSGWEETMGFGRRMIIQSRRLNLSGLANGMFTLVQGRMPNSPTEVAVSSGLLKHLQKQVGDPLSLSIGGEVEIVGEVENPESLKENAVFYQHLTDFVGQYELLVKLPESGELNKGLPNQDVQFRRETFVNQDDGTMTIVFLIGCLALFEAALVIAAAFIVGIRRRQRQIGLLASCGATPRQIFLSLLFSSFLTSLIAGGIGTLVGLSLAWICYPWLDGLTGRRNGPFEICWGLHFSTVLLGVAVSIVSVTVPAIGACRMSVKKALSARSLPEKAGKRWLFVGMGSVVGGILLILAAQSMLSGESHRDSDDSALWAILWGSILGIFGFGMCSPWLVAGTSKLASRLPVSWRLAVREIGRYRARNATMVTAILAAMSLSVMSATLYQSATSAHQRIRFRMQRDQIAVVGPSANEASQQIMKELGAVARAELRGLRFNEDFVLAGDFTKHDGFSAVAVGGVDLLKVINISFDSP